MLNRLQIQQFEDALLRTESESKAAKEVNSSIRELKAAYRLYRRPWPISRGVQINSIVSIAREAADDMGLFELISKASFAFLKRINGVFVGPDNKTYGDISDRDNQSFLVIEYIQVNGGTIKEASAALSLNVNPKRVRNYARRFNLEYSQFRHAYQSYGKWRLMPCELVPIYSADYLVKAICTGCNREYESSIVNIKSGSSSGCFDCSKKSMRFRSVKCVQTGIVYKSMRSFAKQLNVLDKYQSIRKELIRKGEVYCDGKRYTLC